MRAGTICSGSVSGGSMFQSSRVLGFGALQLRTSQLSGASQGLKGAAMGLGVTGLG